MTSRERVLAAIDHRRPDRVPVDLGATPSSGISAMAYGKLKTHLGIDSGHTRVYDVVQQLAQPEETVLDRLGIDAIDIGRAFNTEDGMRTYSAALSVSNDDIDPTQGAVPTNTESDEKDITSGYIGVSQIISKNALVRFGLGYTYRDGFLTDPYKFRDSRPDERKEWVFTTGYRRFFDEQDAALQVDYRYFDDDWEVAAHTLDVAWVQNIGSDRQFTPFVRYYSQDEAEFFANIVDLSERYYADDYRLSAFGAFSYGARLRQEVGNWVVNLAAERYQADESWGLYSGDESPGLVEAWRYSVGLDYIFK